ncbi:hypothetical protein QTN25_000976 [Entamoeba marina]
MATSKTKVSKISQLISRFEAIDKKTKEEEEILTLKRPNLDRKQSKLVIRKSPIKYSSQSLPSKGCSQQTSFSFLKPTKSHNETNTLNERDKPYKTSTTHSSNSVNVIHQTQKSVKGEDTKTEVVNEGNDISTVKISDAKLQKVDKTNPVHDIEDKERDNNTFDNENAISCDVPKDKLKKQQPSSPDKTTIKGNDDQQQKEHLSVKKESLSVSSTQQEQTTHPFKEIKEQQEDTTEIHDVKIERQEVINDESTQSYAKTEKIQEVDNTSTISSISLKNSIGNDMQHEGDNHATIIEDNSQINNTNHENKSQSNDEEEIITKEHEKEDGNSITTPTNEQNIVNVLHLIVAERIRKSEEKEKGKPVVQEEKDKKEQKNQIIQEEIKEQKQKEINSLVARVIHNNISVHDCLKRVHEEKKKEIVEHKEIVKETKPVVSPPTQTKQKETSVLQNLLSVISNTQNDQFNIPLLSSGNSQAYSSIQNDSNVENEDAYSQLNLEGKVNEIANDQISACEQNGNSIEEKENNSNEIETPDLVVSDETKEKVIEKEVKEIVNDGNCNGIITTDSDDLKQKKVVQERDGEEVPEFLKVKLRKTK